MSAKGFQPAAWEARCPLPAATREKISSLPAPALAANPIFSRDGAPADPGAAPRGMAFMPSARLVQVPQFYAWLDALHSQETHSSSAVNSGVHRRALGFDRFSAPVDLSCLDELLLIGGGGGGGGGGDRNDDATQDGHAATDGEQEQRQIMDAGDDSVVPDSEEDAAEHSTATSTASFGNHATDDVWLKVAEVRKVASLRCDKLKKLTQCVEDACSEGRELEKTYKHVTETTNALHHACENLIAEEAEQTALADALEERLQHLDLSYATVLEKAPPFQPVRVRLPPATSGGRGAAPPSSRSSSAGFTTLHSPETWIPSFSDRDAFFAALGRLDQSFAFVLQHPEYADTARHLSRLRQLYQRSLGYLRDYLVSSLRSAGDVVEAALVQERIASSTPASPPSAASASSGGESSGHAEHAFLYVRFALLAPKLRPCVEQLQMRAALFAAQHSSNLPRRIADNNDMVAAAHALLRECETVYFLQRVRLLRLKVSSDLQRILIAGVGSSSDSEQRSALCTVTRNGCFELLRVCADEYRLCSRFFGAQAFSTADPASEVSSTGAAAAATAGTQLLPEAAAALATMLRELAEPLFDVLRPQILRSRSIETLVQVVYVLRHEVLSNASEQSAPFAPVAGSLMSDVQERLVFLAQQLVGQSIAPAAGVVASLDRSRSRSSTEVQAFEDELQRILRRVDANQDALIRTFQSSENEPRPTSALVEQDACPLMPYERKHGDEWLATLERTLVFLSKIYTNVDPLIFADLAAQAVSACTRASAAAAAVLFARSAELRLARRPDATVGPAVELFDLLDGKLLLLKHLLVLREQLAPFAGIPFEANEQFMDFAVLRRGLARLFRDPRALLSYSRDNPLLALVTALTIRPPILVHHTDAKAELEGLLRKAMEDTIATLVKRTADPVLAIVSRSMNKDNSADPESVRPSDSAVRSAITATARHTEELLLPSIIRISAFHLPGGAGDLVVGAVLDQMVDAFRDLHEAVDSRSRTIKPLAVIRRALQARIESPVSAPPQPPEDWPADSTAWMFLEAHADDAFAAAVAVGRSAAARRATEQDHSS